MKKFEKIDIYQRVTDKILSQLENDIIPWQKPWRTSNSAPRNLISNKQYRGINNFLLNNTSFNSPFWATYAQIRELGGNVKRGEKSELVVYWKLLKILNKKTGEEETIPMLKHFNVFNLEQCENIELTKNVIDYNLELSLLDKTPINKNEMAENIIAQYKNSPKIEFRGHAAYYSPSRDLVVIPEKSEFNGDSGYYNTLFHELSHSTGHTSRLNRGLEKNAAFGSHRYSKEELIAEISASFLLNICGLSPQLENSAAYVKSWLKVLKNDKKFFFEAASKAQKSADYILGSYGAEELE